MAQGIRRGAHPTGRSREPKLGHPEETAPLLEKEQPAALLQSSHAPANGPRESPAAMFLSRAPLIHPFAKMRWLAIAGLFSAACGDGDGNGKAPAPDTPALRIEGPRALPPAVKGVPYEARIKLDPATVPPKASGTYVWTRAGGAWPPGLALTVTDGPQAVIAGTATATGAFSFALRVESPVGGAATRTFALLVLPSDELRIEGVLPDGVLDQPYHAQLTASGDIEPPVTWQQIGGQLPAGLILSSESPRAATISGVPLSSGNFDFVLEATDAGDQAATRALSIRIGGTDGFEILTKTLPEGRAGARYWAELESTGATGDVRWRLRDGELPPGLVLEDSEQPTARIEGRPSMVGAFSFEVELQRGDGRTRVAPLELTVMPELQIETDRLADGSVGKRYRSELRATGGVGPYQWRMQGAPPGVRIAPTTELVATLTGTVGHGGSYPIRFEVEDSEGFIGRRTLMLVADDQAAPLEIAHRTLPPVHPCMPVAIDLKTRGGSRVGHHWMLTDGALPPGLSLGQTSDGTWRISGKLSPQAPSSHALKLWVRDSSRRSAEQDFQLDITPASDPAKVNRWGLVQLRTPAPAPDTPSWAVADLCSDRPANHALLPESVRGQDATLLARKHTLSFSSDQSKLAFITQYGRNREAREAWLSYLPSGAPGTGAIRTVSLAPTLGGLGAPVRVRFADRDRKLLVETRHELVYMVPIDGETIGPAIPAFGNSGVEFHVRATSPSGRHVVQSAHEATDQNNRIAGFEVVDVGGAQPRIILRSKMPRNPSRYRWSPDGRHLVALSGGEEEEGLWVSTVTGTAMSAPRRVGGAAKVDGQYKGPVEPNRTRSGSAPFAISPDGRYIAFSGRRAKLSSPHHVYVGKLDEPDAPPIPIGPVIHQQYSTFRWSADSQRLYFVARFDKNATDHVFRTGPSVNWAAEDVSPQLGPEDYICPCWDKLYTLQNGRFVLYEVLAQPQNPTPGDFGRSVWWIADRTKPPGQQSRRLESLLPPGMRSAKRGDAIVTNTGDAIVFLAVEERTQRHSIWVTSVDAETGELGRATKLSEDQTPLWYRPTGPEGYSNGLFEWAFHTVQGSSAVLFRSEHAGNVPGLQLPSLFMVDFAGGEAISAPRLVHSPLSTGERVDWVLPSGLCH